MMALFDTVDHSLLAHCLANAGAGGTVLEWLMSVLHGPGAEGGTW